MLNNPNLTVKTRAPSVMLVCPDCAKNTPEGCVSATPETFNWALLARHRPDVIVAPLTLPGALDIIDIAETLVRLQYPGKLRAVIDHLPDPEVARREIRRAAPGLDFEIWILDQLESVDQEFLPVARSVLRNLVALAR